MPLHEVDSYRGRKALARLLRDWGRESKENTFKSLAKKQGLQPKTVAKIASETTKWPRIHTILAIWSGIGFTMLRLE